MTICAEPACGRPIKTAGRCGAHYAKYLRARRDNVYEPGPELLLSHILSGAPALSGAKCRGRPHLFDPPALGEHPDTVQARHHQAVTLCSSCPALTRCAQWFEALPPRQHPGGVVAGQVRT